MANQPSPQTIARRMRSLEMKRRADRYNAVIAMSREPVMRALARLAQAKISGVGAVFTYEEVAALYESIEEQLESALRDAADRLESPPTLE